MISWNGATGLRGGGSPGDRAGGEIQPARTAFGQDRVFEEKIALTSGRHDLGDDAAAIGDKHRLAAGGEPYILTELCLQGVQADGSHERMSLPETTFVNQLGAHLAPPGARAVSRPSRITICRRQVSAAGRCLPLRQQMGFPQMSSPYFSSFVKASLLAMEAQQVIALRLMRLAAGGALAEREMTRMLWEKAFVTAHIGAAATAAAATGKTGPALARHTIAKVRRRVRANDRRLRGL